MIPVFFAADENYVPYLAVAIKSLIKNASREHEYKIYVMHDGINAENQARIKAYEEEGFEIIFKEMKAGFEQIKDEENSRLRCDYFTLTIYFRLFIPAMFPEYDKGIYLDSDVVVEGDISKLYETDLEGNLIGACKDLSIREIEPFMVYVEQSVGVDRMKYINSGVLLMDLKRLREAELDRRFLELYTTYHFDSIAPDQDYINAMCYGKIYDLPEEWDIMPNENRDIISNPQLIHYNLFAKPWMYKNIQYEEYFWKYAKMAGFYEENLENQKNYTDEQKQADTESAKRMVETAIQIVENGRKFASVFNSGKEERL